MEDGSWDWCISLLLRENWSTHSTYEWIHTRTMERSRENPWENNINWFLYWWLVIFIVLIIHLTRWGSTNQNEIGLIGNECLSLMKEGSVVTLMEGAFVDQEKIKHFKYHSLPIFTAQVRNRREEAIYTRTCSGQILRSCRIHNRYYLNTQLFPFIRNPSSPSNCHCIINI